MFSLMFDICLVYIWCRHLKFDAIICHWITSDDIRYHLMSSCYWPSLICCQDIPWGGHQRQTELSVCESVSLSVCLSVNFWFIELPTQLKIMFSNCNISVISHVIYGIWYHYLSFNDIICQLMTYDVLVLKLPQFVVKIFHGEAIRDKQS